NRIYYRPALSPTGVAGWVGQSALPGALGNVSLSLYEWRLQAPVSKPYPKTDYKVFRTELTGLLPNTTYEFRIGKSSPFYRFRTMPSKATNTISFNSGGDCGVNPHAVMNNQLAARQDPHFIFIGGDLGYDNGRSVEVSLAFLRNYSRHAVAADGRLIPLITCIGNHEVDGGYDKPREKAPFFYALFDGLFTDTGFATLDFGDYLSLVLLDSGHTSAIAGEQTSWLEQTLRARREHPHVIVAEHVPAYPSYRSYLPTGKDKKGTGEDQRLFWTPLFDQNRVPVVLEHHDHTFKRTKPLVNHTVDKNGVHYLGDGSWGRLRVAKTPEQLSYLAKSATDFHLSLHRLEGEERYHVAMDATGKVMDVCQTGQRLVKAVRASAG
ncbi:MAG TPA: metallophosphoesterase family protein, partial [Gemmatales bacterium]|nr:metallophosphoesterase family protein [Gemmatales bacterium]